MSNHTTEGGWVVLAESLVSVTDRPQYAWCAGAFLNGDGIKGFVLYPGRMRHGGLEMDARPPYWIDLLDSNEWQLCNDEGEPIMNKMLTAARLYDQANRVEWSKVTIWEPPTDKPAADNTNEEVGSW